MAHRELWSSLYAGFLFAVLGAVTWATGEPFVFPSLGPTAFVLAIVRRGDRTRPDRVVGGHAIGAAAGLVAYTLLGDGAAITNTPPPLSEAGLRLAASGVLSVALTAFGMIVTGAIHSPACATTLIVSLGLLATLEGVVIIVISVILLVAVHRLWLRVVAGSDHSPIPTGPE